MSGKRGAPLGNNNGGKAKPWSDVIRRVAMRDPKRLNRIAETLLRLAEEGDLAAMREFGDRFEGKIPTPAEISGAGGQPIKLVISALDAKI